MRSALCGLVSTLAVLAVVPTLVSAVPLDNSFTYQGQLEIAGVPANATADFQFSLWNAAGGPAQVGSTVEKMDISLVDGLFTVSLDFGSAPYNGQALWLEIAVRSPAGAGLYTTLAQRQPLSAVPYARYAAAAPSSGGGTLDAAYDFGGPGAGRTITADTGAVNVAGNGGLTVEGNGGFGTTSPAFDLHVRQLDGDGGTTYGTSLGLQWEQPVQQNPNLNEWFFFRVGGNVQGGGGTRMIRETGSSFRLQTKDTTANSGAVTTQMTLTNDGRLGLGTETPTAQLEVEDAQATFRLDTLTSTSGSIIELHSEANATGINPQTWGALRITDGADNILASMSYGKSILNAEGLSLSVGGSTRMKINSSSGNVGIGTTGPKQTLHVNGSYYGLGHLFLHAYEGDGNSGTAYVQARDDSGNSTINLRLRTQSAGSVREVMTLTSTGRVGIGTTSPTQALDVVGTARVDVLQIDGGADLSERFVVNETAEPGTVLTIDSSGNGGLTIARSAYDRRVAGIVSGAGGIKPGMTMGQAGSTADGDHVVALTGRVYCLCDATNGPITAGDLLTTSDTPGHAMKVTDFGKAQGAIIGKAMTSLSEGKGLVLVLVNLQ